MLMTMSKPARTIPAGRFKAICLALLDEVAATHQPVVVTKRGRPVARIVPVEDGEPPSLLGSVIEQHDIVAPIRDAWRAER